MEQPHSFIWLTQLKSNTSFAMDGHEDTNSPSKKYTDRGASPSSSSKLASLIRALTVKVNRLASVMNNLPPVKHCRSAENEPDRDSEEKKKAKER